MKNNKKTIDALQSDLSWLDDIAGETDSISKNNIAVNNSSARGQLTKIIEIGGQSLVLSKPPSVNSIAAAKELSKKMKGIPKSESHRAAIRAAADKRRGKPNGRKGIPHSEIHKQRIGDSNRGVSRPTCWNGRKHREDTKEKLRQFNLNRDPASYTYSAEKKSEISNKISAGKKGKPRSPEILEKRFRALYTLVETAQSKVI